MVVLQLVSLPYWMIAFAAAVASVGPPDNPAALSARAPSSHVRPTNSRLAGALHEGMTHSQTMRGLVSTLDASSVIVYLHDAGCVSQAESCLMIRRTSGSTRFVHVNFRMTDGRSNRYLDHYDRLVAQIAHELQHAVELARDPTIVDGVTLAAAYGRKSGARRSRDAFTFETEVAVRTGRHVLLELSRQRRR